MTRLLAILACLVFAAPAYAQKTKATIASEITNDWQDNTTGEITPALLRSVVTDILNSYIDMNGAGVFSCGTGGGWIASLQTTSQTCIVPASVTTQLGAGPQLATAVMIGADLVLTPQSSGNVFVSASGYLTNTINYSGCGYALRYGNGTPPAAGATAIGSAVNATVQATIATVTQQIPFHVQGYIPGLTLATGYWFDVAQINVTSGNCQAHNVDIVVLER